MTGGERNEEGSEDVVEDLEAPAAAQDDVAGGAMGCAPPSCVSKASDHTIRDCIRLTLQQVEHLQ
jgi:hypothetical protein